MKKILILTFALFLTGCGEKFDASTESMIKISYNGILADLEGEEKENFVRQFDAYTDRYVDPFGGESGDGSYEQNDIESLHGLSYGDVVDRVAEHEKNVQLLTDAKNVMHLTNLHVRAVASAKNMNELIDKFDVVFGRMGDAGFSFGGFDAFGGGSVVVKISNTSEHTVKTADVCVNVVQASDSKDMGTYCYEVSTQGIPPNHSGAGIIADRDIWEVIRNKQYKVTMYVAGAYDSHGTSLYPIMDDEDYSLYAGLKAKYPDELQDIVAEYGSVPE